MLSADELEDARADAEREMLDVCDVWRPTGETNVDPVTFEPVPVWEALYENLPCIVNRETHNVRVTVQGDAPQLIRNYFLTTPVDVIDGSTLVDVDIRVEDVVVVTESADPQTTGFAYTVRDPWRGSLSISRRFVMQRNDTFPRGIPEGS